MRADLERLRRAITDILFVVNALLEASHLDDDLQTSGLLRRHLLSARAELGTATSDLAPLAVAPAPAEPDFV